MNGTLDNLIGHPRVHGERCAIVAGDARTSWNALSSFTAVAGERLLGLRGERVGVLHRGDAASWAALVALERLAADVFLLDAALPKDEVRRLAEEFRFAAIVEPSSTSDEPEWKIELRSPSPGSGESSVTILTSGTSGRPKAANHTWASLCRPVRNATGAESESWLLTYRPQLYAGLQVSLQCFASGATLVVSESNGSIDQAAALMVRERVTCMSATPSYWRQLLLLSAPTELAKAKLRQITLGGELVDQQVLDILKTAFPSARIAHIYATTELGRCFSVTDGQAGFPARFLGAASPDGVELRIDDGELQVRSANAMRGYDAASGVQNSTSDWFATGDLVRCEGDRCYFVGRKSDMINVGGNKVSPQEVEQVLRDVPGVAALRVYAKPSSLVGQLVAVQVVPICAQDSEAVRAAVVDAGLTRLTAAQRPRVVEIVDRIDLSEAGKTKRT